MAERIQARAIRRCGELLKQVQKGNAARDEKPSVGAHTPVYRRDLAEEAGLSKHQQNTAIRVASIPERQFHVAVESDNPPTLTALAKAGTQSKPQPLVDYPADGCSGRPVCFLTAQCARYQIEGFIFGGRPAPPLDLEKKGIKSQNPRSGPSKKQQ